MKSVLLFPVAAIVATVSAEGSYSSNPSGSTEQNKATEIFLEHLNKHLAENYLYALIICTAAVFLYHTSTRISNHIRHLTSLNGNPGSQVYFSTHSPWMARLKDHLLFAPLLHHRRASPIKFSRRINLGGLPARFQTIFIAAVVVYNVFACVWNVPWSDPQLEVLPVLRNRTGTIATVNLIPIVIMSTIKNPLINILEISYDSFNLMHRWLGRVAILQGITHMLCWLIAKVQQSGWEAVSKSVNKSSFIYCGLIAVIGFTSIGIQAVKLWRALAYEVFLHLHIALVAMTFGGLWHHLEYFPQGKYLLAAIIFWGGSRLWRFATTFWRSIGWGTSRGNAVAIVEALPGDAMRVEFSLPRPFKATAGQSIYLCIPSVGFWTFHPFSLAWSESYFHGNLSRSTSTKTTKAFGVDPEKSAGVVKERGLNLEGLGHNPNNQTFSLVIKKHDGFTKKLYERAIKQPPNVPLSISALVEGPYGHQKSFSSYGTVLLFASGVGITHQMPYIRSLVDQYALGTTATKRITLVWVVPHMECLEWVRPWMHEILFMERRREILQCRLFITRATLSQDVKSPSETVRMSRGRPNVLEIVTNEARERVGCLGVSVCAGGGLADEVRRASRSVVAQGVALDFIEEGFGW